MIIPPLLSKGTTVYVVAPAGPVTENQVNPLINELKEWQLIPIMGKHLLDQDAYLAGSDKDRLFDLQTALDAGDIGAIFCARGGYGSTRILDQLRLDGLSSCPKWLIGFSDITALHLLVEKAGITSIHGPMASSFGDNDHFLSTNSLKSLLFEGTSGMTSVSDKNKSGMAQGRLIGGNLALLADSIGTQSELNTDGRILIVEDVGEPLYKVDRMMTQLLRADKFQGLQGLVAGSFIDMQKTSVDSDACLEELILDITAAFDFPVGFGFPVGHGLKNIPFVHGGLYDLEVGANQSSLTWRKC